jgi:hypothetical protein
MRNFRGLEQENFQAWQNDVAKIPSGTAEGVK